MHEPFAPSASSVALRTARALSVGTFHNPTERVLSTQFGRQLSQLLFSRLDARIASYEATRTLMDRFFPADYRVVLPAAEPVSLQQSSWIGSHPPHEDNDTLQLVFVAEEERAALRTFLRALRLLPIDAHWRATVWSSRPLAAPAALGHRLSERVRFVDAESMSIEQALGGRGRARARLRRGAADAGRARAGACERDRAGREQHPRLRGAALRRRPRTAVRARRRADAGRKPRAARERPRAAAPACAPRRRRCGRSSASRAWPTSSRRSTARLVARRHDRRPHNAAAARIVADRPLIDVDLHMHTDHSYDCATPVEVLLAEARAKGLGAIAVTEHNEISGALEAAAKAKGIKVIVGEEVKTASQGEVIGLFIKEKIPRGMTLQETIAEIKRQGGLVYVPHPFDRMHSVPDYKHLLDVLDDIDLIEVFNPRVAISEFNEEAVRFAAKYRIDRRRRLGRARAAGARLGADPDARLRRARAVPGVAAAAPTSSATRPACSTCRR